jgi:MarR family transcriptional regulator, organic hydroperoxide resistance regulator
MSEIPMSSFITFANDIQQLTYQLVSYYAICDRVCVEKLGVTASQGYILLALAETDSVTMNDLSVRMKLANSTMTRMADQLLKKGLLTRGPDPADRRIVRVRLTKRGQDVRTKLKKTMQELYSQILKDIPQGEREQIVHSLKTLEESIVNTLKSCCAEEVGG